MPYATAPGDELPSTVAPRSADTEPSRLSRMVTCEVPLSRKLKMFTVPIAPTASIAMAAARVAWLAVRFTVPPAPPLVLACSALPDDRPAPATIDAPLVTVLNRFAGFVSRSSPIMPRRVICLTPCAFEGDGDFGAGADALEYGADEGPGSDRRAPAGERGVFDRGIARERRLIAGGDRGERRRVCKCRRLNVDDGGACDIIAGDDGGLEDLAGKIESDRTSRRIRRIEQLEHEVERHATTWARRPDRQDRLLGFVAGGIVRERRDVVRRARA